jgi:hypothetical protein
VPKSCRWQLARAHDPHARLAQSSC